MTTLAEIEIERETSRLNYRLNRPDDDALRFFPEVELQLFYLFGHIPCYA